MNKKIVVVGAGYVGLSLSTLLAVKNEVVAVDISKDKVDMINYRKSPIEDDMIIKYFKEVDLNLRSTSVLEEAVVNCDFVIIATPTNYDELNQFFDTSSIINVLDSLEKCEFRGTVIIKSTIPVGFTDEVSHMYENLEIIFSPEFLREGKALYDNLNPSRVIIGSQSAAAIEFSHLLVDSSYDSNVPVLYMDSIEAEAVKLFSNSYLALRVAYFNELDTYCEFKGLNSKNVIDGVSCDPRIGNGYNNPSFGYGGYCLPKDTKQLKANFGDIPNDIVSAIVSSNETRKKHIVNKILERSPSSVGIFRLSMKSGSDNYRSSSIIDIITLLKQKNILVWIYEPMIEVSEFNGCEVITDLEEFKLKSDLVISNRMFDELQDITHRVYTRDIYNEN